MGNTPSVETHRRAPQKLSKPRTGNPSTAGLLSTSGFVNSPGSASSYPGLAESRPYPYSPAPSPTAATVPLDGVVASEEPVSRRPSVIASPPQDKQQNRRSSLFRSRSSYRPPQPREQPPRRHSSIGPPRSGRVADRAARTTSMTFESFTSTYYGGQSPENWPPAETRASRNYDLNSYEAKRLLNLVEEPASFESFDQNSTVSETKFSVVSEVTWKSSHPAQQEGSSLSRANSDLSMYTPVRRRSIIQTPGVATRRNSNAGSTKPNFRHSHPPTPNLSRQASFESNASRVLSMPPLRVDNDLAPRVVTPCEGDYKTIGAFKLGSLRITNADASPTQIPEVERSLKVEASGEASKRGKLDYFSSTRKLATGNIDEPKRQNSGAGSAQSTTGTQLSPIAPSFSSSDIAAPSVLRIRDLPGKAAALIGEYLEDLQFSPFSVEESPISAKLQTTSKQTAEQDQLFEDDNNAEYTRSSAEILDIRVDPSAKSKGNKGNRSLRSVTTRSDSGIVPSPSSDYSHKPLSKADSGYSSNVSLRSLRATSKPPVPEKDAVQAAGEKQHPTTTSPRKEIFYFAESKLPSPSIVPLAGKSVPAAPQRDAPPPPPPPKDRAPMSPVFSSTSSVGWGSPSPPAGPPSSPNVIKRRPVPSPINSTTSTRGPEPGAKSPDAHPLSPSARSEYSVSALSIGSSSHRLGRLQRLLSFSSSSRTLPTVHITHVEQTADIPSVPRDVEDRFHEHTGLFPTSSKRLALRAQLSRETLKTIFSVGSMEINSADTPPAVPSLSEVSIDDESSDWDSLSRQNTLQSIPPTIIYATTTGLPMVKPIVRKPVPARKQLEKQTQGNPDVILDNNILDVEAELTTYSSINSSLGNNPYDAAIRAMRDSRHQYVPPVGRAMSMTAQLERNLDMRMAATKFSRSATSEDDPSSPGFLSPALPDILPPKKAKTPPPVSMMTRKKSASLRVPPPLRPQSTPPTPQSLSRQSSRESLRSSSSQRSIPSRQDTISPPAVPPMNPRRSRVLQGPLSPQAIQYRAPNWDPSVDTLPSRPTSVSNSRSNSLSSRSQGSSGNGQQRPPSAPSFTPKAGSAPPLRHRASYDGFQQGQRQLLGGNTQSLNAYLNAQSDPWNNSQGIPAAHQWDQGGRYPPYVPRGHSRNSSMGNWKGSGQVPYRILHSYNSPAYRGAPIWG